MTEVEALLSVDAGHVPEGAEAFFPADPEVPRRRLCLVLAVSALGVAIAFATTGADKAAVALMVIAAGVLGVMSSRTLPDEDEEPRNKRPTLVITPTGLIIRDHEGLRTWRFTDVEEVRTYVHDHRVGLLVVRHDGRSDFIDCHTYQRGERVRELVRRRLQPDMT